MIFISFMLIALASLAQTYDPTENGYGYAGIMKCESHILTEVKTGGLSACVSECNSRDKCEGFELKTDNRCILRRKFKGCVSKGTERKLYFKCHADADNFFKIEKTHCKTGYNLIKKIKRSWPNGYQGECKQKCRDDPNCKSWTYTPDCNFSGDICCTLWGLAEKEKCDKYAEVMPVVAMRC